MIKFIEAVKSNKVWLGLFLVMFLVPEVLFATALRGVAFLFNLQGVLDLLSKQLVQASSFIFYTTLIFEVVGIVGLLITFDRLWKKTPIIIQIISIILIVMLISLIFTIYLIFSFHPQFG